MPTPTHHARSGRKRLNIADSAIFISIDALEGFFIGFCAFLAETWHAFCFTSIAIAWMSTRAYLCAGLLS
jgi:hypothetical protein